MDTTQPSLLFSLARQTFTRYRETLYLLTGVAAAFAVVYCQNQYFASPPSRSLRRRNAVRRRNARSRRRDIPLPSGESQSNTPQVIQALDAAERERRAYGTFRIEMDDGRTVDCPLIPSQLTTVEQLQRDIGASTDNANMIRRMMEEAFLDSFLAMDRPSREIRQDNGEWGALMTALLERGLSEESITSSLTRYNSGPDFGESLRRRIESGEGVTVTIQGNVISEETPTAAPRDNDGDATVDDAQSIFSWREGNDEAPPAREGQNLLNLLYHIAEDQARKDGYIHRGVTCNSCGVMPIQGIRYRCANCVDYDLCETCEAMQVHIKTHLFYKVRIPAPFLGNPRQSQPVWYPGKPIMMPRSLPRGLAKRLMKETNFENTELDALWDQFRCLASVEWPSDPNKLNMAIDRKTFDRCFVPNTSIRPPPPSLIYDRMFAFYDTNGDNLIGFEEFLKGLASFSNKSLNERLKRIFNGYDIDRDGYVERKDFLRIFRAYYTLSRELTRDMVAGMEDDFLEGSTRDVVLGSQPISAAFPGNIPLGEMSRVGEGKRTNLQGDQEIVDNGGILREDGDDTCDRHVVIGDSAVREESSRSRPALTSRIHRPGSPPTQHNFQPFQPASDSSDDDDNDDDDHDERDATGTNYSSDFDDWPPADRVTREDIMNALGAYVPLEEVMDPVDRARIGTSLLERYHTEDAERVERVRRRGVEDRWQRRAFYTDEEDGSRAPPGYHEQDDNDEAVEEPDTEPESESHAPSPRSRSSSKVRFQDDITDNEYETRSNPSTSSRSIPVGERWGGFEIPEVERDAGKEILYQVTQQGLNELLDLLFKRKEDLLMEAHRTRGERKRWAKEIENFAKRRSGEKVWENGPVDNQANESRAEEKDATECPDGPGPAAEEEPLQGLLNEVDSTIARESGHVTSTMPDDVAYESESETGESIHDTTLPQYRPNDLDFEPATTPGTEPFPTFSASDWNGFPHVAPLANQHEERDPTLPQNRPDTADDYVLDYNDSLLVHDITSSPFHSNRPGLLGPPPIYESASTSTSASAPRPPSSHTRPGGLRNRSLPLRLRFEQSHPTSAPRSTSSSRSSSPSSSGKKDAILPSPPRPPSPATLESWSRLNQIEREAKERGGTGAKLNFEEFAVIMRGDLGKRLAFVGSWIDMTSF